MRIVSGPGSKGHIWFITNKDKNWNEEKSAPFDFSKDTGFFQTVDIDIARVPSWKDMIIRLRLVPIDYPAPVNLLGLRVMVASISMHSR
jgi:hypothetical protein